MRLLLVLVLLLGGADCLAYTLFTCRTQQGFSIEFHTGMYSPTGIYASMTLPNQKKIEFGMAGIYWGYAQAGMTPSGNSNTGGLINGFEADLQPVNPQNKIHGYSLRVLRWNPYPQGGATMILPWSKCVVEDGTLWANWAGH